MSKDIIMKIDAYVPCEARAVSYTHLDVYKRQFQMFPRHIQRCDVVAGIVPRIVDQLQTRVDVYKRQARNRGIVFLGERTGGLTLLHFHL